MYKSKDRVKFKFLGETHVGTIIRTPERYPLPKNDEHNRYLIIKDNKDIYSANWIAEKNITLIGRQLRIKLYKTI